MSQIILASQSPRRKELLEQIGLEFEICPAKGEEIITKDYTVTEVTSASGHVVIKFCPYFKIKIAGKSIRARFGLSDRSKHRYPILIGRRTISGKFLVDVSKDENLIPLRDHHGHLRDELQANPYEFYKKYYLKED